MAGSLWRARQRRNVTTYGSAHWASDRETAAAGLYSDGGIFLGRARERYLRHDGPEHVMAFAPTRSGKGVGLVVPTLLGWSGSTVIHDIKGENWQLTAGWRMRFSHCLLFNPTDARSARYNPLLEVRRGADEVRDVQNIADILVDPEGALDRRNHWEKTSHSLLVGAILHILYADADKTLSRVATFLSDPQRPFVATLRVMMTTNHLGTPEAPAVHPVVASAARELLNKSENERSGVLSTAMSFLGLYRDPTVAAVTAASDWRIADLVEGDHPVSLYLVVPPSDISRTKPLIRLVLNQIGRRLTEHLHAENKPGRHRLLMMLDEFPALGRLDFFETSLAFLAGYGVRAFLVAQSLNQIEKAYGEHNAILDNCHVRVAFATNDERTAKRISDALGTATEQRAMRNYAGHRLAPWLAHVMVSRQETARALLTPGEVMQLAPVDEIVLVAGHAPVRAKKLRYYEDRTFKARSRSSTLSTWPISCRCRRSGQVRWRTIISKDRRCWSRRQASVVAPVLTYLFHRLEERFDGRPTLLILDEAWIFLDHPLFAARIREWLKTLRKKNVAVLFATQSLADVAGSSIAPAIIDSCPQRILLPNDRAIEPQSREAYARFGLNDRQIELVSRATPKRHYYLQSARGNRLFELGLSPVALALCGASDPASQRRIDSILAEGGPQEFTERFLREADLGWAADLLASYPPQ